METFNNMSKYNWIYTLQTSNGRTVFSRDGNKDAQGLAVDQIKWLLDESVPDNEAVYYTDKLSIMNEEIWGVEGDRTIGPKTFGNLANRVNFSKTRDTQRDSGLRDVSDDEISRRAADRSLSGEERRRYQKEEKLRGLRNVRKRQNRNNIVVDPENNSDPGYVNAVPGAIYDDGGNVVNTPPLLPTIFPVNPIAPTSDPIIGPVPIFGW